MKSYSNNEIRFDSIQNLKLSPISCNGKRKNIFWNLILPLHLLDETISLCSEFNFFVLGQGRSIHSGNIKH